MAKDTDVVNLEPKIEGETPEPTISGTPAGQPLDQAGDSAVTLEAVEKLIQKEVQSIKDTRLGKHGTRLDNLEDALSKYDSLQAGGMSKEQAASEMSGSRRLQDLEAEIEALKTGKDMTVPSAGAGAQSWADKQASILSGAGIETNDPRLTELLKSTKWESYDDYLSALSDKTFDWKQADAKKPQPSSSTVAQTVPSVVAVASDFDEFTDDQIGDKLIALSRSPSINQAEMDILDAELTRRDKLKE